MAIQLPTKPQTRAQIDPRQARFFVGGMPKSGKTTLLGGWAPSTTLILDTQHGTDLLEGEHFVIHIASWADFVEAVNLISRGGHPYMTIGIDLIDDIWRFAGQDVARRLGIPAAMLADYGKGTGEQEAIFVREIGRLVATPLGLWFLSHVDEVEGKKIGKGANQRQLPSRMVPKLDKRVRTYVQGLAHFVFLAETLTGTRQLRTTPTADFEAGGRLPLPSPMPMDVRELYKQILAGLKVAQPPAKPVPDGTSNGGTANGRAARTDVPADTPTSPAQLAAIPVSDAPQEGDIAPPGSRDVALPDGPPAAALAALRAAGCPCVDPLRAATTTGSFDEACPVAGHGVPWGKADEGLAEQLAAEHFPPAAQAAADAPTEKAAPPAKTPAPAPAPETEAYADSAAVSRLRSAAQGLKGDDVKTILGEFGIEIKLQKGIYGLVPAGAVDVVEKTLRDEPRPPGATKPRVRRSTASVLPDTDPAYIQILGKLADQVTLNEVRGAAVFAHVDLPAGAQGNDRFAHLTEEECARLLEALKPVPA